MSPKEKSEKNDVDARFLLANERTLLAWLRTSLALLAGGLALTQIGTNSAPKEITGVIVISAGGLTALIGHIRFQSADKAMRAGDLPAAGYGPSVVTISVIFIAFGLVLTHIFGIW
jgi:putative membrane protein